MNIVLRVVAGLLALAFLASGALKLIWSRERLVAAGMGWAAEFSPGAVRAIGVLEILGAAGLVAPVPALAPLAATGLALLMAGALITHLRRRELPPIAVNVVFLALATLVAWNSL